MAVNRIHTDQPLQSGTRIVIGGQTAQHVLQVLRLRPGTALRVFDGQGHEFDATLESGGRGSITLAIGSAVDTIAPARLDITLAQGIARHDRMDLILQKAVELGVHTIQPLWMQRSQSHVSGERLEKRQVHWRGILISACEQCGRSELPALLPAVAFADWIADCGTAALQLLLQPGSAHALAALAQPQGRIVLLVGPEGGLNDREQMQAIDRGFTGVRLGQRILRTETAALAAIAGMQTLWGDYRD